MQKSAEAFRTISEVAAEIDVPKHVLRFWEGKFAQLKPMKRGGGRRYYRPEDVDLLKGIRQLLYGNGYTIKGVQKLLREQGIDFVKGCYDNDNELVEDAPIIPDLARETAQRAANQAMHISGLKNGKLINAPVPSASVGVPVPLQSGTKSADKLRSLLIELEACKKRLDDVLV